MNTKDLKIISETNRKRLLEVIYNAKAGHTGGDLSCLNMMTVLYHHYMNIDPKDLKNPNRDRFILSKGHCVESLFVVLESLGILSTEVLNTLGKYDSPLAGHPTINVPGIEVNSGALGHGLPIGVGMAIAAKMNKQSYKTFVMMGDGEQGEGSIYEAAMAGNQYKLDNLVAIIDRNMLQISGCTEDVMAIDNVVEKWSAFGWDVIVVNGDSIEDIIEKLDSIDYTCGKPHLLLSKTTKGLGVSYMENVAKWHHGVPSEEQYNQAMEELEARIQKVKEEA
ncbi:MAG: transketolase [Bacteroidales bacterium]|nr:transketolase [Bacteroidales bacterium]